MTDLIRGQEAVECGGDACEKTIEAYPAREAMLGGGLKIRRALPVRGKRMIGAWCFLDHFGPHEFKDKAMDVASHPHIGLQTVTWLLTGEVLHKDSLGYEQVIHPGQLNIMTAGRGISHSEETPAENGGTIHGVQFWVATPDADRHGEPAFAHYPEVPVVERPGMRAQVMVGESMGVTSPAKLFSPMVGVDVALTGCGEQVINLKPEFEHGVMVVEGTLDLEGVPTELGTLYDLGRGRNKVHLKYDAPARLILIGGAPFGERIVMWWNFVARTSEEIEQARNDWQSGTRFGEVKAYKGGRLDAPDFYPRPI